ncbi:SDR family NAD(P)-dependent oxidoreductase [Elusimicrobiota bacterium]
MGIFKDKIAIVTGGASGIGRAIVEELARRGAAVIIADIQIELAREVAQAITRASGTAKAVNLDVTDHEAVKKLVANTAAEYGRLDYMFNNAGVAIFAEARDASYDDWKKVIDVDLYGPVNGSIAAYAVMVKQGFGHIINTASMAGLVPASHLSWYVTSKHGVVGLSHSLRLEGAALGVKVSVVCPGLIKTPMYYSPMIRMDQEKLLKQAPKGMKPEKCARIILKGVEHNKATIMVTALAKIAYILYRISPGMMFWLGEKIVKKTRKEFRTDGIPG